MQKITFRKLIGENYIYPELQGHFIEFLGSCIYDGIWVGEPRHHPRSPEEHPQHRVARLLHRDIGRIAQLGEIGRAHV